MTGEIITGRYEKRGLAGDAGAAAYYCVGEKAVCNCGVSFIIPTDRYLHMVEIEDSDPIPEIAFCRTCNANTDHQDNVCQRCGSSLVGLEQ